MTILFMSIAIPKIADENRIKQDTNEENTTDPAIPSKNSRANQEASMEMAAIILNNSDATSPPPPDWLAHITPEYATATVWIQSTGTAEPTSQANAVLATANRIQTDRFPPASSRVT